MNIHPGRLKIIRDYVSDTYRESGDNFYDSDKYPELMQMVLDADESKQMLELDVWRLIHTHLPHSKYERSDVPAVGSEGRELWVNKTTEEIADALRALPKKCRLLVFMPGIRAKGNFFWRLSNRIALVADTKHQLPIRLSVVFREPKNTRTPHLSIEVEGFFYRDMQTGALSSTWGVVKQAFCMLRLFGLTDLTDGFVTHKSEAIIEEPDDGDEFTVPMPYGLDALAASLSMSNGRSLGVKLSQGAPPLIVKGLELMSSFFSREQTPAHDRLAAAMEWLVDAEITPDQTLCYIAACIGLEALLGDQNELPTARLADRYSHLLGSNRADRAILEAEFASAFRVRGQLVHAREARLRPRELASLGKVRSMLQECLERELHSFLTDGAPLGARRSRGLRPRA